ncbi:hypothetical protein ACJIZ3_012525 [Penstemon smallii]|uniref:Uncharacterized protein n=1 Tax=Penstemon smallii TaxID=265156 RepID=A0ABD3UQ77_9LAMI
MISRRTSCFTGRKLCKSLVISLLFLSLTYIFLSNHPCCKTSKPFSTYLKLKQRKGMTPPNYVTNISHIFFGIAGSSKAWNNRKSYIQSWWRPNITRGLIFMERSPTEHFPWASTFPPFHVSEDNSKYKHYNKHLPFVIRITRMIEEAFNAQSKGVRWYVMADDDTILFVDNLVEVLSKYDHRKYYYVGMRSESIVSNCLNSFDMAFGGGGYALSYPLAKAVARNMDSCIKRYPTLFGSDHIMQSCIADLGVSLTQEKGFHQIDLHRDISGFLSAHPQSPLLSLHHLEAIEPIFPSMNRYDSLNHLMKAAKIDQSRLLQQSICYYKKNNWTFSVSWGYSVQIYENIIPPSFLYRPLETFIPWKNGASPPYMFNARSVSSVDPCGFPHFFLFSNVDENRVMDHIVTSYKRKSPRGLPTCVSNGSHSADYVSKIRILSPVKKYIWHDGSRRECCDIVQLVGMDSMAIKLRDCMNDEIIA